MSAAPVPYEAAVEVMEARVAAILQARAPEAVWLLEHPPLYTAGTSAAPDELLDAGALSGIQDRTRRPLHLSRTRPAGCLCDARLSAARPRCARLRAGAGGLADRRRSRASVSKANGARGRSASLSARRRSPAIGIRVRRWVSFHGVSLNVDPDLSISPASCPAGLTSPVTSLAALGAETDMTRVDAALRAAFDEIFGASQSVPITLKPRGAEPPSPVTVTSVTRASGGPHAAPQHLGHLVRGS